MIEKQATHGWNSNRKTILIVDDDLTILKFLSCCLTDDFSVLTADSCESALQQSKAFAGQIHLLLTDILLPKMNGVELAIKVTTERPGIRVVLISGFGGEVIVPNPEWLFLPKPFKQAQLISLVNSVFFSSKSSSANA